jgi:hypothetical protein
VSMAFFRRSLSLFHSVALMKEAAHTNPATRMLPNTDTPEFI